MRIASWNVNSLTVRLAHLQDWLARTSPNVVVLQETKLEDARFPDTELATLGYRSVFSGQRTYNGVALLSRGGFVGELGIRKSCVLQLGLLQHHHVGRCPG